MLSSIWEIWATCNSLPSVLFFLNCWMASFTLLSHHPLCWRTHFFRCLYPQCLRSLPHSDVRQSATSTFQSPQIGPSRGFHPYLCAFRHVNRIRGKCVKLLVEFPCFLRTAVPCPRTLLIPSGVCSSERGETAASTSVYNAPRSAGSHTEALPPSCISSKNSSRRTSRFFGFVQCTQRCSRLRR